MSWRDVTSYQRGKRGVDQPVSWELNAGGLRITVTKIHGYGEDWYLRCHDVGIDKQVLDSVALSAAKREALALVQGRLTQWSRAVADAAQEELDAGRGE